MNAEHLVSLHCDASHMSITQQPIMRHVVLAIFAFLLCSSDTPITQPRSSAGFSLNTNAPCSPKSRTQVVPSIPKKMT